MERVILHVDMNNFYAGVEALHRPELRECPFAVCGDIDLRHGIVLAKNGLAKAAGVKTGDVVWEARQKCPGLATVSANFTLYLRFSRLARGIYERYTDQIESFGIDECWLDVTGREGRRTADEIREAVKHELGCTASVGVSWNKIFAKLGSDLRKPDATTVISRENYKRVVYPLPVGDLLYVGRATEAKLRRRGCATVGDLAATPIGQLRSWLGKWGETLWTFATGCDPSPVAVNGAEDTVKSVGNSTTAVRDLCTAEDVRMMVTVMAESVAARLREQWLKGQVVHLALRDQTLETWGKQTKIKAPTFLSADIIGAAMALFRTYPFPKPVRSLGVKVSDLSSADAPRQLGFLDEGGKIKAEALERTVDIIRARFGHGSIGRALLYKDRRLTDLDPKSENVIHPYSYF